MLEQDKLVHALTYVLIRIQSNCTMEGISHVSKYGCLFPTLDLFLVKQNYRPNYRPTSRLTCQQKRNSRNRPTISLINFSVQLKVTSEKAQYKPFITSQIKLRDLESIV